MFSQIFRRRQCLSRGVGHIVTFPRLRIVARRRSFADKGDTEVKHDFVPGALTSQISDDGPNSVLLLDMIEHAQLPRHWDRHVQQSTFFSGRRIVNPAPNGVTFTNRVISVHSKSGVSRTRTRTGKWSASRSRIRFQFLSSVMGAY